MYGTPAKMKRNSSKIIYVGEYSKKEKGKTFYFTVISIMAI